MNRHEFGKLSLLADNALSSSDTDGVFRKMAMVMGSHTSFNENFARAAKPIINRSGMTQVEDDLVFLSSLLYGAICVNRDEITQLREQVVALTVRLGQLEKGGSGGEV